MIIGLAGSKTAGKNTAANFIADDHGDVTEIKEWSFAAKLKQSAAASLLGRVLPIEDAVEFCDNLKNGVEISVIDDNIKQAFSLSGREFLQWYGTEAHREIFGEDFWVDAVMSKIPNPITELGTKTDWDMRIDIITDVRFPNEAKAITGCGGRVMRINRKSVESGDSHASEIPLPPELVWAEIPNNGTLDELHAQVRAHTNRALEEMYIP